MSDEPIKYDLWKQIHPRTTWDSYLKSRAAVDRLTADLAKVRADYQTYVDNLDHAMDGEVERLKTELAISNELLVTIDIIERGTVETGNVFVREHVRKAIDNATWLKAHTEQYKGDAEILLDQVDAITRLQAIVDCCAAECEPDDNLEVNERVAVLRAERDDLKGVVDKLTDLAIDLRSYTHDWDWKYGEYWDNELAAAEAAKEKTS